MEHALHNSFERCERCGSTQVLEDFVDGVDALHLAECKRCTLRWTVSLCPVPMRAPAQSVPALGGIRPNPLAA